MWNCTQIIRRRLPGSPRCPVSAVRIVTTLLCLATFGGVVAVALAAIGKTDAKSTPGLTNSAKPVQPNNPAHETAAGNPLWATPIEALAATRDRPLFSPTRRQPPPAVFSLASAQPPRTASPRESERPPLLLIGTVAGKTKAIAVFFDQKTNRTVRLRSGQSQYGWLLAAVYKREVILQKDDSTVHLPLSATAAPTAAAPTQVAETRLDRRQR